MKQTRKAARKAASTIEDELAKIGHDLASLGAVLGETASAEASARLTSLRERVGKLADEASTWTDTSVGEVRDAISKHPLTSVAAAFGLGVLLAGALRR